MFETKVVLVDLILVLCLTTASKHPRDHAASQLPDFKEKTKGPIGILETNYGSPVDYEEATNTFDTNILENDHLFDSLANLVRERVPERVVHAKAGGARGYFEATHDITDICKADFLSHVGKKTPLFARLSLANSHLGTSDTTRGSRGLAIKIYTKEGNQDFLAIQTPVFDFRDPALFVSSTHSARENPQTNLPDANSLWDFLTNVPETLYSMMFEFGDEGLPLSYRHFDAFPIHTYELENKRGDIHYVKFSFVSDQGTKFLTSEQGRQISSTDPDYMTRDLYNAIANGSHPSWTVYVQVMSPKDAKEAKFDPLSLIKVWPKERYPFKEVGRIVLDENPKNHFAEVQQVAFCPSNLVPGILGAPDRVFQARRVVYKDAQRYRIGKNFWQLPINSPVESVTNLNRDGLMTIENQNGKPNYYPNSFHGVVSTLDKVRRKYSLVGKIEHREVNHEDIFSQASDYYKFGLDEDAKCRLVGNIVESLRPAVPMLQKRAILIYTKLNKDLGHRIDLALNKNATITHRDSHT